ncbi:MAG: hypothetical protein KKI02_05760, partial [Planctomycetes bacterium]|nr:hypothetical protein [Planctomycetota bacterium]
SLAFTMFERAWTLCGMETLLMAMIDDPRFAHDLFDRILEYDLAVGMDADIILLSNELELVAAYVGDVQRIAEANDEAVRLVRQAVTRQEVDWKRKLKSPVIDVLLPNLSPQKQLARLLCTMALYNHHIGNDAEAVGVLRDTLRQAELVPVRQASLISHYVEIAIQALVAGAVEETTPGLRIAGSLPEESKGIVLAGADDVRALVADLLREDALRDNWCQAYYAERLMMLDCAMMMAQSPAAITGARGGGAPSSLLGHFTKPMFQLDGVFMMELCTAAAEAGTRPDYVTAQEALPHFPAFGNHPERTAHLLSSILLPSFERVLELRFRVIGERRMAATALAIRLYELDHGHRPLTLTDLVPGYLPAVPRDPFATDGRTVGYLPDAPKPILYCVGLDGVDDGGEYVLRSSGSVDGDLKDQPFFLNGDRPRPPFVPSSDETDRPETVEDDGEEVGDGGQADENQTADEEP